MGRKGSELCASEKESILSLSKANIKLKEISEITGRPISTICSFFKRQERRGIEVAGRVSVVSKGKGNLFD